MAVIEVPRQYGYCVLVATGSSFMLLWKAMKVGHLRRRLNFKYPAVYSPDNNLFNCYQRAHQSTLETYPTFLMLLLLGGLHNPVVSAVGGAIWCAGRVIFALGYYTGDPRKRTRGNFGFCGLIAMLYCTGRLATGLLGWF
ncbi:glutathione S-transferase 3, mitochondrial-like isoform X3 [Panulirus ornatus]